MKPKKCVTCGGKFECAYGRAKQCSACKRAALNRRYEASVKRAERKGLPPPSKTMHRLAVAFIVGCRDGTLFNSLGGAIEGAINPSVDASLRREEAKELGTIG